MMDRFERIKASLEDKPVDRRAYALWKHFPGQDRDSEGFAQAHLQFFHRFQPDLLKLNPHGRYCIIDWGGIAGPTDPVSGSPSTKYYPIQKPGDHGTLTEIDPNEGEFGKQLIGVKKVADQIGSEVPLMMTIFSPFMVMSKIDSDLPRSIASNPEGVHETLKVIQRTMTEFALSSLDEGSHGLFIASQHSTMNTLADPEFEAYEKAYTLRLLNAVKSKARFLVFHLHGQNPRFETIARDYPINAINWHSQETAPTLQEGLDLFKGGLLGGLEENSILRNGTSEEIEASIKELSLIKTNRLIVAPGCVIPIDTPLTNLDKLVQILRGG